ncbi:DUF6302 family protein [Streptomyces sp. NPDC001142]
MTAAARLVRSTPLVSLRPAVEAYDYEYYRDRLAEPALLGGAVAIRVHRAPLLAVPVGGPRLGGSMSFGSLALATTARDLLHGRPGFPDLRVYMSLYRDADHTVEWGEPAPPWWADDVVNGRFYGYHEAAISQHLRNRPRICPLRRTCSVSPQLPVPSERALPTKPYTLIDMISADCDSPPFPEKRMPRSRNRRGLTFWHAITLVATFAAIVIAASVRPS